MNFPSNSCGTTMMSIASWTAPDVQAFIGTEPYKAHKAKRFRRGDNQNIAENEAFLLSHRETRKLYEHAFTDSTALYYGKKPTFQQVIERIADWIDRL